MVVGVAFVVLMVAVPAMCSPEPSPPGPILVVGDSLLYQMGDELLWVLQSDGWEVHLDAVIGAGIAGGGSPAVDWSDRLQALVDEHDPELVIVELGTNGCGPGCRSLEEEIDGVLDELNGVPVVLWLGVRTDAPLREDPVAINAALAEAADDRDEVTVLPFQDWFAGHPELVSVDGVHLSHEGEAALARHLRQSVRDNADVG